MDIKLTIGITVYNKEKYIRRCLNSVLKTKGVKDLEIICVDDGSSDESLKILRHYAAGNHSIRVIHTDNHGEFKARQEIIRAAKGEWIGFVDCDDEVRPDMYLKLLNAALRRPKVDIVICGYQRIDDTGKLISRPQMVYFGDRVINTSRDKSVFSLIPPSSWNRIYRTEVLRNTFDLKRGPRILSDMLLFGSIIPEVRAIAFVGEPLYRYRINGEMATFDMGYRDLLETEKCILVLKEYYAQNYGVRYNEVLEFLVFLHVGLFFTIDYGSREKGDSLTQVYRETVDFLNKNFPRWKRNRYLKLSCVRKYPKLFKTVCAFVLFKMPVWPAVAAIYRFLEKTVGLELKW